MPPKNLLPKSRRSHLSPVPLRTLSEKRLKGKIRLGLSKKKDKDKEELKLKMNSKTWMEMLDVILIKN